MGTDGIDGVELIKKAGGLIIVQSPKTCQYRTLPTNVIKTGFVDYVLRPEDMQVIIQSHISK